MNPNTSSPSPSTITLQFFLPSPTWESGETVTQERAGALSPLYLSQCAFIEAGFTCADKNMGGNKGNSHSPVPFLWKGKKTWLAWSFPSLLGCHTGSQPAMGPGCGLGDTSLLHSHRLWKEAQMGRFFFFVSPQAYFCTYQTMSAMIFNLGVSGCGDLIWSQVRSPEIKGRAPVAFRNTLCFHTLLIIRLMIPPKKESISQSTQLMVFLISVLIPYPASGQCDLLGKLHGFENAQKTPGLVKLSQ